MAAIAMARRRAAATDRASAQRDEVLVPMPSAELVRHDGNLEKQADNGQHRWRSMYCALTDEILAIRRSEGLAMIDWIPLEGIVGVELEGQEDSILASQGSLRTKGSFIRRESEDPSAEARETGEDGARQDSTDGGAQHKTRTESKISRSQTNKSKGYPKTIIRITTMAGGHNGGRDYVFRAPSPELAADWCQWTRDLSKEAIVRSNRAMQMSIWKKLQQKARALHDHDAWQGFFGVLIVASFILSVVVAEMRPPLGSNLDHTFNIIDDVFTGLFSLELLIAIVGFWMQEFFSDPWMVFDFVVVGTSIWSAASEGVPAMYPLRAIRVLRAVKLLKKLGSLRVIVQAMMASVIPVANSFILLGLIMMIYTTVAVSFFGGRRCAEVHGRALCQDEEPNPHFNKFSVALLSMFQVVTGDSWAADIMKSTMPDDGTIDPTSAIFFVSFMMVGHLVLINIVIAVLLDEFLSTLAKAREESTRAAALEHSFTENHVLDPLLEVLVQYRSRADLRHSIVALFERIDADASGYVSFDEMCASLSKLMNNIYFSQLDWDEICVQHIADPQERNNLSPSEFEKMIMHQLKLFHFRHINKALMGSENTNRMSMLVLKWILTFEEEREALLARLPGYMHHAHTPLTPMVHGGIWADRPGDPLIGLPPKIAGATDEQRSAPPRAETSTDILQIQVPGKVVEHKEGGAAGAPEKEAETKQTGALSISPVQEHANCTIVHEKANQGRPAGSPPASSSDWNAKQFLEEALPPQRSASPLAPWSALPPQMAARFDNLEGMLEGMNAKMAQIERLNAIQDSVAKLSEATGICKGCGYCRCGDGGGEGKSSGSPPQQPGNSAVGYPEQVEKKLDDIFKMLVDMKDAGSKTSSAVDAKTPTVPQSKPPTVPQVPEDVSGAQTDSPPPSAVHFDTRPMSADAHGAGNSSASGRVITPNGGGTEGGTEGGEGGHGRGGAKRRAMEEAVVEEVDGQHKKPAGAVVQPELRSAAEPPPSKSNPNLNVPAHKDMVGIDLSSRNGAGTPGGRGAGASSRLFQLPISDKASPSDSAHQPAPVPTTQFPSFSSPPSAQGSFVDVSSENSSPSPSKNIKTDISSIQRKLERLQQQKRQEQDQGRHRSPRVASASRSGNQSLGQSSAAHSTVPRRRVSVDAQGEDGSATDSQQADRHTGRDADTAEVAQEDAVVMLQVTSDSDYHTTNQ